MKLKMCEYFQGAEITGILSPGQIVDTDVIGEELGIYLLIHRKAEAVEPVVEVPVVEAPAVEAPPVEAEYVEPAPKKKGGKK